MTEAALAAHFRQGQEARQRGDLTAARDAYAAALSLHPEHPFALNALGNLALADDPRAARAFFARAVAADPAAPELWTNLAKAAREIGDDADEQRALDGALALDQRDFMAQLRSAELRERRGEDAAAAAHWAAVVALAAQLDPRPPGVDHYVRHGAAFLERQRTGLADAIAGPLATARESASGQALRRFDACVDVALGRRRIYRNECHGLDYPFLPADEFFDRIHFPWLDALEAHTPAIRAEVTALLADRAAGIVPYVSQQAGTPDNKWTELNDSLRWGAFFLWKHGRRDDAACARCPATAAAIEQVPRSDIPGRSPTVFFSLLEPRTRIPSHTGVTNTRAIIHLPLIVPPGCGFRVGGETRAWVEGQAFAFDDTIEHEAWNDSDALRAVLIFDVWNPHLDDVERRLLRTFFEASDASGFGPAPSE